MAPIRFGVEIFSSSPIPKIVELVQFAEELGYNSVWLTDSQLIMPELYTKLAACAVSTKRITLGPGVTNTRTRHPTVTASALASLADLAPGRVAAAISVGGSSHFSLGWKPDRLADFRRNFELIAQLLQGGGVDSDGRELKLVWADPERTRNIDLYVHTGSGNRNQRQAGEMGCPVALGVELQELPHAIQRVNEGAAAAGRPAPDSPVSWWVSMAVSNDWEAVKGYMAGNLGTVFRRRYQRFLNGDLQADALGIDVEVARRVYETYDYAEHGVSMPRHAQILMEQPDEMWRGWLQGRLVGTPDEVLGRLRQALQHEQVSEVVFTPHLPTEEELMRALETFAKQVRPLVSGGQVDSPTT